MTEKRAYSFSRIEAFDCPRRFDLLYNQKKKEPSNLPREIGSMAHEVMANYLRWLYKNKRRFNAKILARGVGLATGKALKKWPPELKGHADEAFESLENLFQTLAEIEWKIEPNVRGYFVEEQLAFDDKWNNVDWFDPRTRFRAIVDWAYLPQEEDTLYLTDHKSGWGDPDPDQLPIYAFSGWKGFNIPVERVLVSWHFIARGGKIEEGKWFTPDELKDVKSKLEITMARIDANKKWDPVPGAACSYCGFTADCPAIAKSWELIQKEIAPFILDTPAQAIAALDLKVLVSARLKDLEKILEIYVLDHGPIKAAGSIMERREKEEWLLTDPYGIQKSLKELGVHPLDLLGHLKLSKSKLYDILKATGLTRHYGDLTTKHGELNKTLGNPKVYKAKKEERK